MLRLISTLFKSYINSSVEVKFSSFKLTLARGNEADFEKSAQVNNKKSNALFIAKCNSGNDVLFLVSNLSPSAIASFICCGLQAALVEFIYHSSSHNHLFIYAYELMLGLHVFRQTEPPRRVDCLAPPPACHMKMEAFG